MMNLSEMLTNIKMDLGIYGLSLPIDDLDARLYDVIKMKSLKVFSLYYPNNIRIPLDIANLDWIQHEYHEAIFRLPDVFGDRRIISIRNVTYGDFYRSVGYATSPEMGGSIELYDAMMMSTATAHLNSAITPPFTFKFESPNIIHMYNFSTLSSQLYVDVCLEHFDNLMSIPNSAFMSFYDLALLDIKIFLFNIVKHFDQIQTAHGTITLKIDDWEQARDKREEMIKEWKSVAHLNGEQFIIA